MDLETDLVVLSTALVPSKKINQLAELLGLELDEHGFFPSKDAIEDIYVCGAAQEPKDIPSSIEQANAVSMAILSRISILQKGDAK